MTALGGFSPGDVLTAADLNAIGTWTAFTPTFTTGLTVGNGTVTGYYTTINKIAFVTISLEFGSTTAITGDIRVQIPVGAPTSFDLAAFVQGNAYDASTADYFKLMGRAYGVNEFRLRCMGTSGSAASALALSATVPFTWGTGDRLDFGSYYRIS